jgi:hypothetical protein
MAASGGVWIKQGGWGPSAMVFLSKGKIEAAFGDKPKETPAAPGGAADQPLGNFQTDWDEPHFGLARAWSDPEMHVNAYDPEDTPDWTVTSEYDNMKATFDQQVGALEGAFRDARAAEPTDDELDGLAFYVGPWYGEVNRYLWNGALPGSGNTPFKLKDYIAGGAEMTPREAVSRLDSLLDKARAPFNMVAKRQAGIGGALYRLADGLRAGDVFESKGYESASADMSLNWGGIGNWGEEHGVQVTYRIPKGMRGATYVPATARQGEFLPHEHEVLIKRGMKWRVVKRVKYGPGNVQLTVEPAGD